VHGCAFCTIVHAICNATLRIESQGVAYSVKIHGFLAEIAFVMETRKVIKGQGRQMPTWHFALTQGEYGERVSRPRVILNEHQRGVASNSERRAVGEPWCLFSIVDMGIIVHLDN
jgi:hypothetical protein